MMKKLVQLLFLLLALLLPATAVATNYVVVDNIWYKINGNEVSLLNGSDASGEVVIPETVSDNGTTYTVTAIDTQAFRECTGITGVTIPNTVVTIGNYAFYGCTSLSSATLGNSVMTIGYAAFSGCSALTSIAIPNSVTTIDNQAFRGCSSMTSVSIGNSVTAIPNYLFYQCTSLTSVSIGNSVSSIANSAFIGCPRLTSITVASGNPVYDSRGNCNAIIETATNTLFLGCKTTVIPNTVTAIGEYAFRDCSGLTGMDIPASVTSIGNYAFYGCSELTSIDIPASVTSIGDCAFYDCSNLANITIPATISVIGVGAFTNTAWFHNQPDGLIYIGTIAYQYKGEMPSGTRIVIKEGTTDILYSAFYGCSGLTAVEIPSTVVNIGNAAFASCPGLSSITVASGNTVYDSRGDCNAIIETATNTLITGCLTTVIPSSVTKIGNYAFHGCTTLTSVTLLNSITEIGSDAFARCTGLTDVTIPKSVTSIGTFAFDGCTALTNVILPNTITAISNGLFYGCTALTDVNIPNSITEIGNYAFEGCTSLASVAIPGSVTSIGIYAFSGCTSLKDVYSFIRYYYYDGEGEGLSMENYVFYLQDKNYSDRTLHVLRGYSYSYQQDGRWSDYFGNIVEMNDFEVDGIRYEIIGRDEVAVTRRYDEEKYSGDIVIPETVTDQGMTYRVTAISRDAFDGCTELTSVTLPELVSSIGEYAFKGCFKLKSINIPDGVTLIGKCAFASCYRLTEITIPESVATIGLTTFNYCYSLNQVTWNARKCKLEYDYFHDEDHLTFAYCPALKKITIGSEVESIDDEIFCIYDPVYNNIDTVVCLTTQPPLITEDCFWTITYNDATLCVPRQSMSLYATAEGWKKFSNLEGMNIGMMIGDTDGDGQVSIADVTSLIDYLLGGYHSEINAANGDVDGDGKLSIADVTSLIDRLLAGH